MKSFVVIGLGRFGTEVACRLYESGNEVLVIDNHADRVQSVSNDVTHAVVGDARDKEVLRALGVRDFDCAVLAIGEDLAASVLTVMNLKELEVRSDLYNRLYCDDDPAAQSSPYCDFLNAPDDMFTEIPDTILVTAGKDPLHFGAEKLPPKLLISGKSLSMRQFPESQHGFYVRTIGTEWKAARDFILDRIAVHYGITRKESQKAK